MTCPYKGKNVYCPSLYTFPYNVFPYFLEGQVPHKDNKLGIMTNVGKSRLEKVIFTNIHKISDACAVLVDISWLHNVWEMFLLFIKFRFLWKNSVSEKIKAHLPQHPPPQHYHNCSTLIFLILFKKLIALPPFTKEGRDCILYERLQKRDNKVIVILYERVFI